MIIIIISTNLKHIIQKWFRFPVPCQKWFTNCTHTPTWLATSGVV